MPAAKKHATTRARRNRASTAATLQPTTIDVGKVPELPDRSIPWHALTRQWWVDVWTSPMSKEWHPATDLHNVYAAAMHYDDMWQAETALERQKADAAFQKREAALGLTPYDRRRLEWTIASAAEAVDRGARRRATRSGEAPATPKMTGTDPRASLRAV